MIEQYNMTKLHNGKSLAFADAYSRSCFDASLRELEYRHRNVDDFMESGWRLHVPGFASHLLAFTSLAQQSKYMTKSAYLLISLLGLTWPYRVWLESHSVRAHYRFVKEIRYVR